MSYLLNQRSPEQHLRATLAALLAATLISLTRSAAFAQDGTIPPDLPAATIHVVQPGETLDTIAGIYGLLPDQLASANNLGLAGIQVGQRLIIPAAGAAPPGSTVVIVGFDDSLAEIAALHGMDSATLARLNHIVHPDRLIAGQSIRSLPSPMLQGTTIARTGANASLWELALRANSRPYAILLANHLRALYAIPPGKPLAIPGAAEHEMDHLADPWLSITLRPLPLEPGRSAVLSASTTVPGQLSVTFLGKTVEAVSSEESNIALLGIDRWTATGVYPLELIFESEEGVRASFVRSVLIVPGGYAQEVIRLSPEAAAVLSDQETVSAEAAYIAAAMSGFTPERLWDDLFDLPTAGVMSSAFGTARAYGSSGYSAFHTGADFAAPTGTPVYAPADGIVVDTGLLTVRGYVTILDHGWGVHTGYWHQSSILVQPGDRVSAGQQIGTVGNTGLSTASHLHWEMWVGGVQVDPLQWVRVEFP